MMLYSRMLVTMGSRVFILLELYDALGFVDYAGFYNVAWGELLVHFGAERIYGWGNAALDYSLGKETQIIVPFQ
jgi:hypothetical protein